MLARDGGAMELEASGGRSGRQGGREDEEGGRYKLVEAGRGQKGAHNLRGGRRWVG